MGDLSLVVLVGAITFASRAIGLLGRERTGSRPGRFFDDFPLALFVALATIGLVAPGGNLAWSPALAAGAGGVLGAVVGRRSILWVIVGGGAAYLLVRLLV